MSPTLDEDRLVSLSSDNVLDDIVSEDSQVKSFDEILGVPEIVSDGGESTAVVTISENEIFVTDVNVNVGSDVFYAINAGADADLFTIDPVTGILSFKAAPDYETPRDADGNNVYFLNIIAYNDEGGDGQFLSVIVENVDELEIPTIISDGGNSTAVITLKEGETRVTDVNASGASNVVYAINAGADADLFTIDAQTGELSFKEAPDYEAPADVNGNNVYDVNVIAYNADGGDGQFLSVIVQDVEEFEIVSDGGGSSAVVNVNENSTFVTDIDVSVDGGVFYDINAGADADLFTIDHRTGELSFKAEPDYENPADANGNNVYDVNVIAYNNQGDGDGQFISVIINNLQDTAAPTIVSNGGGSTAVINLNEGETQVTDVNISGASDVVYAINAGADADLFTINSQTGELSFKTAPDYENPADADGNNVYFANIITYNQYGGDSQFVSVVVNDVADTTVPEIFSDGGESTAVVYVDEGETDVTDVNASGDSNVVYAINAGADADLFTINSQTGALAFKAAPDYENPADADGNNVYFANVIAYNDQGGDGQFISVIVKDVKETALPPEIISDGGGDATSLSRKEGEKQVTQVVATAADPGSTLTFSLEGGEDASLFSINAYTGALSFQNEPDYENPADSDGDNTYDVVVKVTDAAGQFDRQTLSIDVTNVASVYLMAGQSNMVGYGSNSELPSHLADPYEGAKIWQYDSQSFSNLRPGFAGWSGERDRFGPELTFGREIAERSDEDIYLIKYAQGATSLASDWDPQAANQRYDELISRVEAALTYLEDGGVDYRVEGMVWMQGESDTYNDDYAAAYEDNLSAFIADVRSLYGDDLEFSIGRISNTLPTSSFNRAAVRAAQASVAGQSSLNHLVSTDGLGVIEDGVHFGTQGQIALGAAFADTFDV